MILFPLENEQPIRRHHGGEVHEVDFETPVGSKIIASLDGTVVQVKSNNGDCGNTLVTKHIIGTDTYTLGYCHLSKFNVNQGQQIKQGDILGLTGGERGAFGAGNSKGPHLHFTVKKNGSPYPVKNFLSAATVGSPNTDTNEPKDKEPPPPKPGEITADPIAAMYKNYFKATTFPTIAASLPGFVNSSVEKKENRIVEEIKRIKKLM
jgi:murein DD-endopeptidase MepM/ murein hydrolase activator NlpD